MAGHGRGENVLKKLSRKSVLLFAGLAALLVFASVGLAGGGKIKNYNFETGTFAPGWNWNCLSCNGEWVVTNKKVTPIYGQSWFGPMEKEYSALSDFFEADTLVMWQEIKVGSKPSRLSFDLDWNNRAGVWCDPGDLDYTNGCNQQFQVFIQPFGDDPFDNSTAVKTLVKSENSTPFKQGKTKYSFNLGVGAGDYQLVFAVVATEAVLNVGVDEVVQNNG
jgi:hypothetical protein